MTPRVVTRRATTDIPRAPNPVPMPHTTSSRRAVLLAALFGASLLSCGREITGPDGGPFGRTASLALMPELPAPMVVEGSGDVVAFTRVRAILLRSDNTELLSQVVDFPADADEVPLTLSVPLPVNTPASGLPLQLLLRYINAAGDTVFAGGPVPVVAVPVGSGTGEPQPVAITLDWVGPGSDAGSVELTPATGTAVSGTQTTFTVVVRDGQGQPMTGVPVVFSTPDPTRATVTASSATVTWLPVRGAARVIATLPSGLIADTAAFDVTLPATQLAIVSGDAQTSTYGTALPAPLVVRALAGDGVPVPGVDVTFTVATGGGTLGTSTVTSDANGDAGTTWTLGAAIGAQSVTATFAGLAAPVTLSATAVAGAATQLVIVSGLGDRVAGELGDVVVHARDAGNNLATGFTGSVRGWIETGPSGTTGDTITVVAVGGVATFPNTSFDVAGTYTVRVEAAGIPAVTSAPFTISAGPATDLIIAGGAGQTSAPGAVLATPLAFRLIDDFQNPIAGRTVDFTVQSGGGSLSVPSAVTDANGLVQVQYTLGPTIGAQVVRGTVRDTPALVRDLTVFGAAGPAVSVIPGSRPAGLAAGEVGTFTAEVRDAGGNTATGFNGAVTIAITSAPGGGVLGGTTTRDAVNGIVTFDDLFFNIQGFYNLVITSPGLTSGTINGFPVGNGPLAALVVVSGDAQTGAPSAALAQPVVVRAQDAFGNGVSATVNFAVTGGGGSVAPASAATDANSQAQTTWTLGATLGAQTVRASVNGAPTIFVDVTATAAPAGAGLRTWTGGTSTAWTDPANWQGGLVPTSLDTVLVTAAATFDPVLADNTVISGLTIEDGASVSVGDFILSVVGSLVAPTTPSILLGPDGGLGLQGTTGTVQGALPTTIVTGSYTMNGAVTVDGDLSIGSGSLVVSAYPLTVSGALITGGTGAFGMTGPVDVTVGGDAIFTGGSTAGLLTAGRLFIGGSFTQGGGAPNAFSASPGHETWFSSATPQDIQFVNPGFGVEFSHFGTLYSGQPSGSQLNLLSEVFVEGALETGVAVNRKVFAGAGGRLVSRGADIDVNGIEFSNVRWELADGAAVTNIQNVLFSGMDPIVTQFRVVRGGGAFTIAGITFATTPTTGRYLELEDAVTTDGNVLTVTVSGASPAQYEPGTVTLIGGAQLVGWSAAPNFTWTGAVSADWATAGNWSGGAVPTAADSVFIPAGTPNAPSVDAPAVARTLVLADNANLALATGDLTVGGPVSVGTGGSVTAGDGRLVLTGGGTLLGALGRISIDGAAYALAGPVTAPSGVEVYNGDLAIGAQTLDAGSLFVGLDGTITMTDPAGLLIVGDVTIDGASTAGRLTAGTLRVSGGFFQESSQSDQSFSASGTHVVELVGPLTQRLRLRSPDSTATAACTASCFATLRAIKPSGTGGLDIESSFKALAGFELQADSVSTATLQGLQFVSGGGARFDTPILRVSGIAWRDTLVQNAATVAVDSLVAWGAGAGLVNIPGVRTTVTGTHAIRTPITGSVDVTGTLDVDGAAGISGNLRTLGAGRLQMTGAADSLEVGGTATFSGGPTAGLLENGVLRVGGNFTQSVNAGAFAAGGAHRTRLFNGCALCDGLFLTLADTTTTTFGELIVESGNWDLSGVARAGGDVTLAPGAVLDNGGDARVRTAGSFTMGATSGLGLTGLSVGGLLTVPAGTVPVDTVEFTGTGQTLPFWNGSGNVNYGSVRVAGSATALIPPTGTPQSITGRLLVTGTLGFTGTDPANLTIGGGLDVAGAGARLLSSGALHRLTVIGPARFDGAASTNDLATGILTLGGDLVQAATHSPASLVTAPEYRVELTATGTISFATPAQSSVGILELLNTGVTRTLTTDLTVTGDLQLQSEGGSLVSNVLGAGGTRYVSAPYLESFASSGFTLRNVGLRLASINLDGALILDDFDPAAIQVDFAAPSGGAFAWGFDFRTTPSGAGRYVRATDTAPADGDAFALTIGAPISPEYHGGFAEAVAPATITGWEAFPNFRWNGASNSDWNNAGNWAGERVPTETDSVHIPDTFFNPPQFPAGGVTVAAFLNEYTGALNFGAPLRVTRRFSVVDGSAITCDGGGLELLGDGVTEVAVQGRLQGNCLVRVLSGTAVASGAVNFLGDLQVEGTAIFDPNREVVQVGGNFSTLGGGRLRMTEPTSVLAVGNGASFGGGSTDGLLTDGILDIAGNFSQGNGAADAFAAGGAHLTRFGGSVIQQVSFTDPGAGAGTSHFAHLELTQVEGGVYVQLNADTYATGQLRTGIGSVRQLRKGTSGDAAVLFQSRGADVDAASFFNVRWEVVDGAAIGRMDNVSFTAMDSSSTYLTMRRSADLVTINGMQFISFPQEGNYLRLEDANGATGLFQVTMNLTGGSGLTQFPPALNENVFVIAPAVLLGWP